MIRIPLDVDYFPYTPQQRKKITPLEMFECPIVTELFFKVGMKH